MIGCIGMIHSMQTTLMIYLYPIGYQVIKLLLIWYQRLYFCVGKSISSFIYNEKIVDGYPVFPSCIATILTQTQLCRWWGNYRSQHSYDLWIIKCNHNAPRSKSWLIVCRLGRAMETWHLSNGTKGASDKGFTIKLHLVKRQWKRLKMLQGGAETHFKQWVHRDGESTL